MSDELVGQRECFMRGHRAGYDEALSDISKEVKALQQGLGNISIPLLVGIFSKIAKDIG